MALGASAPAKAACGCGGTCGGSCGCGGARPAAVQRPRFFAGQLLTPEDLSLIVDYAVGKSRLRNRLLFGEGVVCGLAVTCPPCGDGTVLVAPGYALDCCGNDIYLPCPEEVDVNRLVRELRLRLLDGWDCGDPCAAKPGHDPGDGKGTEDRPKPRGERYCLYIRYDEQAIEPVAPYVSDAECGQVACEATRILEGHRFELRCPGEPPGPADILAAFAACLGDLGRAAEASRRAQTTQAMATQLDAAAARIRAGETPGFTEADAATLQAVTPSLVTFAALEQAPGEPQFRRALADVETAVIGLARLRSIVQAAPAGVEAAPAATRELLAALPKAGAAIRRFAPGILADELSRTAALELAALAEGEAADLEGPVPQTDAFRLLQAGGPVTAAKLARLRLEVAQLKAFLAERLTQAARLTRCDLLERLHRLRLADVEDASLDGVTQVAAAADGLAALLVEYLRECLCLALDPPCAPPCEDAGVLLACLEIRDCEVVEICNMSRRFVLSPAALRYWLPPLGWIGRLLERACCDPLARPRPRPEPQPGRFELQSHPSYFLLSTVPQPELDDPGVRLAEAAGIAREDIRNLAAVAGQLGALANRDVPALRMLAERMDAPAATLAETRRGVEAARTGTGESLRADAVAAARSGVQEAARKLRTDNLRLNEELRKVTEQQAALSRQVEQLTESLRALTARPGGGGTP